MGILRRPGGGVQGAELDLVLLTLDSARCKTILDSCDFKDEKFLLASISLATKPFTIEYKSDDL